MNDRKLLELAAKAAGIEVYWCDLNNCYWLTDESDSFVPLDNDGDALRLAVKLCLHIQIDTHVTYVDNVYWADECNGYPHNDDPYAATRRAIVRAAAEIGKEK